MANPQAVINLEQKALELGLRIIQDDDDLFRVVKGHRTLTMVSIDMAFVYLDGYAQGLGASR